MITHTRQILKDLPRFLHKHLGLGTILTLSFMGATVLLSPIFVPRAEQAAIPAFALYSDATTDGETTNIKEFSLVNQASPIGEASTSENDFAGFMVVEKGSSVDSPIVSTVERRNGLLVYKVVKGDLISTLSRKFDVPAATIISANNLKKSGLIRIGQEIVIPNPKVVEVKNAPSEPQSELPDVKKYLSMPVKDGQNLGKLRGDSVDILAACSTPIYASAEGLIDEVGDPSEWNDGLGGYVVIKHEFNNDVATIYAKTSKNLVEVGDLVRAGDKIAEVGNTGGDTEGPTGCHISFGVVGGKNPFVK